MVISWLDNKNQQPYGSNTNDGKESQCPEGTENLKEMLRMFTSKSVPWENLQWKKVSTIQTTLRRNPVDSLHLWHGAFRKDLKETLGELHQIRTSEDFSNLPSIVVQLKFFADALIFYR